MKKYLAEAHFSLDGTSQMTESRLRAGVPALQPVTTGKIPDKIVYLQN